jgi:tetratricopeptide (TPR) repeat protein
LQNLGMVHLFADDYRKALEKFNEAFRIRRKILGPDHPDVFDSLTKGALVHFAIGDLWKAHDSFWAIYDRMRACGYPVVYKILNNIAVTTYELGDIVNAMQVFQGALEAQMYMLQHKSLSEESKRMVRAARASLLENMAFINFDCGFDKHALYCYNEARAILNEGGSENARRLSCVDENIAYIQQTTETANPGCARALGLMDSLVAEHQLSAWCREMPFQH